MLILLVEGNPADEVLTSRSLATFKRAVEIVVARDTSQALDLSVAKTVPEMLLISLDSPQIDCLQIIRRVRSNRRTMWLPVLLLISSVERQSGAAMEMIAAGADDWVVKSEIIRLPLAIDASLARQSRYQKMETSRSSEAKLLSEVQAAVMEAAPYATIITGLDGTIEWLNPAFTRLTQYSWDEAIGKNPRELVKSGFHDRAFFKQLWDTVLHGEVWEGEIVNRRKDGTIYYESQMIAPLRDESGQIRHFVSMKQDVTSRKQTEEAVRDAQQRYRDLVNEVHDGIFITDVGGVFSFANQALAQIHGVSDPAELLGHAIADFLPAGHADQLREQFRRGIECGTQPENLTTPITRRDGSKAVVEIRPVNILENGRVLGVRGVVRDITSRVRAEEQLRLSHSILSQIASVVYVVDRDGAIRYVSPSVENLLGFSPQELQNNGWWERTYIFPDQSEAERSSAIRVARGEARPHVKSFERRVRTRDGSTKLMLWTESTASGDLAVRVGSDITEQRQIEYQFRQAQKMEAIGQLAGGVAHDFNNLLTVINGYGELLIDAVPPDDGLREPLLAMQKAGRRAASLTRQLLAFSRKQVVVPTIIDLNSLVKDLETMLSRLIGEDISLVTVLDPALRTVKADAGQIEQVLMNLVVNARDAMPQGGKLTIETSNAVLDESYADIHVGVTPGEYSAMIVSDTGVGMDEATKARIFEPFFTTKEAGRGTGLGLAVVHGILKQTGGHIQVDSEIGQGTTLRVYLPIAEAQTPFTEWAHSQPAPRGNETVLVAEDEDGVRAIVQHVLTTCGYTVLEARDGIEAMKIAENHSQRIHLLVSDVVMPNMSGRELSERVAKVRRHLKVLFLSGYTDDTVIRHGILQSHIAFLQKPFTASALAHKVREVLDSLTG